MLQHLCVVPLEAPASENLRGRTRKAPGRLCVSADSRPSGNSDWLSGLLRCRPAPLTDWSTAQTHSWFKKRTGPITDLVPAPYSIPKILKIVRTLQSLQGGISQLSSLPSTHVAGFAAASLALPWPRSRVIPSSFRAFALCQTRIHLLPLNPFPNHLFLSPTPLLSARPLPVSTSASTTNEKGPLRFPRSFPSFSETVRVLWPGARLCSAHADHLPYDEGPSRLKPSSDGSSDPGKTNRLPSDPQSSEGLSGAASTEPDSPDCQYSCASPDPEQASAEEESHPAHQRRTFSLMRQRFLPSALLLVGPAVSSGFGRPEVSPQDTMDWSALVPALATLAVVALVAACVAGLLFGLFIAVGVFFQPRWIIGFVRKQLPHIIFEHVTKDPLVALTIDDGPNGETSHELLDILREHDCKATFFVIGNHMDKWPELVERMHAEGHELGNHTMEDVASWRLSGDEFESSLLQVDARLQPYFRSDDSGSQLKWFRPGHGWTTKQLRLIAQSHGYNLALGSVFPMDPLFKESGPHIAQYCLWKIYPGAIIVLHDRPQQQRQTTEILRVMLPELRRRGYEVVTLSRLFRSSSSASMPLDTPGNMNACE